MQEGVVTNRYSYSFNDPVNGRDPSGHCPQCVGGIIGGVGLGVYDLYNGELSSAGTYSAAIGSGALIGAFGPQARLAIGAGFPKASMLATDLLAGEIGIVTPAGAGAALALKGLSGRALSVPKGKLGEQIAIEALQSTGFEIVSRGQVAVTKAGTRILDVLVRDPRTKKLINVEVKADGGKVSWGQKVKDAALANDGGVLKGTKAGTLKDTNQKTPTMDVNVDIGKGCVSACSMRPTNGSSSGGGLGGFLRDIWDAITGGGQA